MILNTLAVGELAANCYIIADEASREAIVIDPGAEGERIFDNIISNGFKVRYIVLTHGHADHISEVNFLKEKTGAKVVIHSADAPALTNAGVNLSAYLGHELILDKPDICVKDGDVLEVGMLDFKVIHTPGHTPGGICLMVGNSIFTGDTLFLCSVGRTDLPGGNFGELAHSIKTKLFILDDEMIVYPGHEGTTTIGVEKVNLREMF